METTKLPKVIHPELEAQIRRLLKLPEVKTKVIHPELEAEVRRALAKPEFDATLRMIGLNEDLWGKYYLLLAVRVTVADYMRN